jgi:FKBP-type peptidyl-prolyl cis-trans isomerase FkpA
MRLLTAIVLFFVLTNQTSANSNVFTYPVGDSLTLDKFIISQNIKAERTPEGVFFTAHTEGSGATPTTGDFVKIRYVGKLLNGKMFDESPKNEPFAFQIGKQQVIQGWEIALSKLRVGAKVTIYVPAKLGYGTMGIGDVIPPNSALTYDIELLDILSPAQFQEHLFSVENAEKRAFTEKIAAQLLTDQKAICEYALKNHLKLKRTESGISYVITKESKGEQAKSGNKITFHYDGMLLDNRIFDSTKKREPMTVKLGEENILFGLEEGLAQFSEGSEGYLLMPSKFGYGSNLYDDGKIEIAGNSVLIFKINVLSVK